MYLKSASLKSTNFNRVDHSLSKHFAHLKVFPLHNIYVNSNSDQKTNQPTKPQTHNTTNQKHERRTSKIFIWFLLAL